MHLHIGMHKTGSTSLQEYLRIHTEELSRLGVAVFRGVHKHSAVEFPLLAAEPEKDLPAKSLFPLSNDPVWLASLRESVVRQVSAARATDHLIISSEGLAFLRAPTEIAALAELLPDCEVRVVLAHRNEREAAAAFRHTLLGMGLRESDDPASCCHLAPGSWVFDHESLADSYRAQFGSGSVTVLDYDAETTEGRSVVPTLLTALALDLGTVPRPDDRRLNSRSPAPTPAGLRARLRTRLAVRR